MEKMNEIEKIIQSGYCSPIRNIEFDEKDLRRKLRALVRKAHVLGQNRGIVTNQFGGDSLLEADQEFDQEFQKLFGFKP